MDRHLTYGLTELGDIQPKPIYVDNDRRVGVNIASTTTIGLLSGTSVTLSNYPYPERIHTFYDYVNITGTSPSSGDENLVEVDWNSTSFRGVPAILITGFTFGNSTPPGLNSTITLNLYWSDIQMGNIANAPIQLANRKTVLSTITLPNSATAIRYWKFSNVIYPEARYLYLSTERSAQDSGSSVSLVTWAVRLVA